jgi:hypothetical protein
MQFWKNIQIFNAFLLAALVPALAAGILGFSIRIVPLVFAVAIAHAVFLGAPVFIFLWKKKRLNFLTTIISGLFIGSIGVGILSWPYSGLGSSASVDGVQTIVNGRPTPAGWAQYFLGISAFAGFGSVGALAFWCWLKFSNVLSGTNPGVDDQPGHMIRRNPVLTTFPTIGVIIIFLASNSTIDRSCHNPLCGGGDSISPVAILDLDIADDQWSQLSSVLKDFAEKENLDFRDTSEDHPGAVKVLGISACSDAGITISINEQRWESNDYQNFVPDRGVGIFVYKTLEGSNWNPATRHMVDILEERWQSSVRFRDSGGRLMPIPETLQ